jgi:hypothetical protein
MVVTMVPIASTAVWQPRPLQQHTKLWSHLQSRRYSPLRVQSYVGPGPGNRTITVDTTLTWLRPGANVRRNGCRNSVEATLLCIQSQHAAMRTLFKAHEIRQKAVGGQAVKVKQQMPPRSTGK